MGPPSLPLYVGIAILRQLRTHLLSAGFNESIMLFSEAPPVDLAACLQQVRAQAQRPPSRARRQHVRLDRGTELGGGITVHAMRAFALILSQALAMARQTPPSLVRRVRDKGRPGADDDPVRRARASRPARADRPAHSGLSGDEREDSVRLAFRPGVDRCGAVMQSMPWWEKPVRGVPIVLCRHAPGTNWQCVAERSS